MSEFNFKARDWGLLIAAVVIVLVVSILMGIADEHDVNNRPDPATTSRTSSGLPCTFAEWKVDPTCLDP